MPAEAVDAALAGLMPRIRRRARRLTGSRDQAEDLAQETALQVWIALGRGRPIDALEHYAMRTLQNLARSAWRRQLPEDPLPEDLPGTATDAWERLVCTDVVRALHALPPAQAALMALVAEGETSPADLAHRTGLAPGTVMSRLARARARLRRDLQMSDPGIRSGLF